MKHETKSSDKQRVLSVLERLYDTKSQIADAKGMTGDAHQQFILAEITAFLERVLADQARI